MPPRSPSRHRLSNVFVTGGRVLERYKVLTSHKAEEGSEADRQAVEADYSLAICRCSGVFAIEHVSEEVAILSHKIV
jgi:aerobic-type carbon monoxide dehydrogenase small subunit (CoxS/CutS family)